MVASNPPPPPSRAPKPKFELGALVTVAYMHGTFTVLRILEPTPGSPIYRYVVHPEEVPPHDFEKQVVYRTERRPEFEVPENMMHHHFHTKPSECPPAPNKVLPWQSEWRRDGDSALGQQEGGSHYVDLKIQPVEYIEANKLGFLEGNVVKYITRHKAKNGAADLRKARHYIGLILQMHYGEKA